MYHEVFLLVILVFQRRLRLSFYTTNALDVDFGRLVGWFVLCFCRAQRWCRWSALLLGTSDDAGLFFGP